MPAPKLVTNLPAGSNFMIGATFDLPQSLAPQRSNTHRLLPSRSTSTPIGAPILRPSGSFAQLSSILSGLGAGFGSLDCAKTPEIANSAAAPAANARQARL